jgi:hypothetical protein
MARSQQSGVNDAELPTILKVHGHKRVLEHSTHLVSLAKTN